MEKNPDNPNALPCVNCVDIDMNKTRCGPDLEVDICPQCGGLWLDGGEFVTLVKLGHFYVENLKFSKVTFVGQNRERKCPHCNLDLIRTGNKKVPDLVYEKCPQCNGVWLDSKELQKLAKVYL